MSQPLSHASDGTNSLSNTDTRKIIGMLYYQHFFILQLLTFSYYVMLTLRDIMSYDRVFGAWLVATDIIVLGSIAVLSLMEKIGVVNVRNVYLTPIPICVFMMININVHVIFTEDMFMLLRGVVVIVAFGIVSFLPWIFWLLAFLMTGSYSVMAILCFPEDAVSFIALGLGGLMVSFGGFAFRDNSIREQIRLNRVNLDRAQKMEQLAKAKDEFLANMSHELRTPLTGLMGMVDLLEEAPLRSEDKRHLKTARASAETLRVIINDVLDFTKLDAGKLALKSDTFSLQKLIAEVAEMMAVGAQQKGLGLIAKLEDETVPLVIGDEARLRQVMFNLIGNAVKFTDQGQVVVSLKVIARTGETITAKICVEDTGVGISEEGLSRLFGRFEQIDSSSTRVTAGTGLGLAISKQLMALMNAEIAVESTVGVGSLFSFEVTLPISEEQQTSAKTAGAAVPASLLEAALNKPAKLLVAEDNPVNQMLLKKFLERENWHIMIVGDGGEALARANAETFDMILLDIQMPVMNGHDVAADIRSGTGPNKNTPLLAITANCMPDDVKRYKSIGFNDHIAKPIDRSLFYQTIAKSMLANTN